MIEIGIRSSSVVRGSRFEPDDLKYLKDFEFTLLELNFNHARSGMDYRDMDQAREIRAEAERLGIRLVAHCPDTVSYTSPDWSEVESALEEYEVILSGLAAFGAQQAVSHACGYLKRDDARTEAQATNFSRALPLLAEKCERHQIKILVETLIPPYFTSDVDLLIATVDAVDSPWVGVCLDTNHLNLSHDLASGIRKVSHRLGEVHANDNHFEKEEHLLPWLGMIDWDEVAETLVDVDYDGDIVMEPSFRGGTWEENMAQSRQVADRLAGMLCSDS